MSKSIYFMFVLLSVLFVSCEKTTNGGGNSNTDCSNNTTKSFSAHVSPIIQNNCTQSGCHGAGSTNGPGPLLNYTQISTAATAIRAAVVSGTMPKNSSLTTAQKNSIICWVDAGALNN